MGHSYVQNLSALGYILWHFVCLLLYSYPVFLLLVIKIWGIFSHYSFKYFSQSFLFLLSGILMPQMRDLLVFARRKERALQFLYPPNCLFSQLFRLDNFHWFVFKCNDFCYLWFDYSVLLESFLFGYYIFQFSNFHLVPFYLHFFAETFYLFTHFKSACFTSWSISIIAT